MSSEQVGGYIANVAALAVCCLAEFVPTESLTEMVFSRLFSAALNGDTGKMDNWAREVLPEFQWSLMGCQDRFGAESLNRAKGYATGILKGPQQFTPAAVSAVDNLQKMVEHIEFERFANSISDRTSRTQTVGASLEKSEPIRRLAPKVASALEEADQLLGGEGEFHPKIAADLIRTAMDEAHREIVEKLESIYGPYDCSC